MSATSSLHLSHYPVSFGRAPVVVSDSTSAILVDGGFSYPDSESVIKAIAQSGKKLTEVYVSQSDPDFYFSLKPIKQHFPHVPVLSKPSTLAAIQGNVQKKLAAWGPMLKENGPQTLSDIILPTASDAHHLKLGTEIIEVIDTALPNRYYLWSNSLRAIFGGVLVFADVHVWVADLPSAEQRAKWVHILDEMLARKPKTVIAGHMQPNSAIDASAITYTRQYLLALEEERAKAANSAALIEAMKKLYPNAGMEVALDIGAKVLMGEMQWDFDAKPQAASTSESATPLELIKSTEEGKSGENAAKLFIFGGNGNLGSTIISAITSNSRYAPHFHVTAVIRSDTLRSTEEKKAAVVAKLRASGVTVVEGDFDKASVEEVAKWIGGQDIVLSTIAYYGPGAVPDQKLVEAVKLAKVPWFIPSSFGIDVQVAFTEPVHGVAAKVPVIEAIRKYGINSFDIMIGTFLEYIISPFGGVDIANATLTAPYSFDAKFSTTKVADIAHLTAELLLRREENSVKNQSIYLAGDTLSYTELHHLLEERFKKPFKKVVVSKEEAVEAWKKDDKFENVVGRFRVIYGEQKGVYWDESWNAEHAKEIKVTTVKEYLAVLP